MPHAPALLPEVSPGGAEAADEVRAAIERLPLPGDELVILCSPHGRAAGIYASNVGDLSAFGVPRTRVEKPGDPERAIELAALWGHPFLEDPLDHGAVVPLLLGVAADAPTICCAFPADDIPLALQTASRLTQAIEEWAQGRDVVVIASVHTGAGLSARAPIPETEDRWVIETEVRAALEKDLGALEDLAPRLAREGGSCSAATLSLFGRLFGSRSATDVTIAEPFGVGYPVLQVS